MSAPEGVARELLAALDASIQWDIINLGSDNPITLNELIAAVAQVLGQEPIIDEQPPQPGDVRLTHADITKARALLDWEPQVSLDAGLQESAAWWESTAHS